MSTLQITVAVYVVASLVELYLFLMQRATLEISRAHEIEPAVGRHMLPLWYNVIWPTKLARWVCIFAIWRFAGWIAAGAAILGVMVATTVWPVPYAHFVPMFKRKVSNDMGTEYGAHAPKLMVALLSLPNDGQPRQSAAE